MSDTPISSQPLDGIQLNVQYKHEAVLAGFNSKVTLLCELIGPETPSDLPERTPLHLALVLDRSGSMSGRPLTEAKRCAAQVVEKLGDKDKVSVVIYDNKVHTLVPLQVASENRAQVIRKIHSVQSGGSTNLYGGWEAGKDQLVEAVSDDVISRDLLLSDGQANVGRKHPEEVLPSCQEALEQGISTSTYGLGRNFNEDLMVEMANSGGGSTYYGQTADDLEEPFNEEFDMLRALCAKDVHFSLQSDHHGVKVLNTQLLKVDAGVRTSPLAYESKVWVAFDLEISKERSGDGTGEVMNLAVLEIGYLNLDGERRVVQHPIALPSLNATAFSALTENTAVTDVVNELKASDLQMEATQSARRGDWPRVHELLAEAKVLGIHNPWVRGVVETLEELAEQQDSVLFSKEARYSSRSISAKMRARQAYSENMQEDVSLPSFLRRKSRAGKKRDN